MLEMIFHKIKLHSSFLLKSHDNLQRKIGSILSYSVSLLMAKWGSYLALLGQSQKTIELLELLLKSALRFWDIVMECSWYRWKDKLKIHLAVCMASVITMIFLVFQTWTAWLIPHLIENNSASVKVIFIA